MSSLFFKRDKLPDGWLDLGIGEANIVRESLLGQLFSINAEDEFVQTSEMVYQPPAGNARLLRELDKMCQRLDGYQGNVIVINGAKQGVLAALMTAKNRGCKRVGTLKPVWPPLVQSINALGMEHVYCDPLDTDKFDCYLLVSPNNPDGRYFANHELLKIDAELRRTSKFLIHDAVYYCEPYIDARHIGGDYGVFGDVQIYSAAKMFGLSGARVGWSICRDEITSLDMQEAVEITTAGVSGMSQIVLANVIRQLTVDNAKRLGFLNKAFKQLDEARKAVKRINKNFAFVDERQLENFGAFAWLRKGPIYNAEAVRTIVVDGESYGQPEFFRINLLAGQKVVHEFAARTKVLTKQYL